MQKKISNIVTNQVVAILGLWANMPTSNVIVIIFFSAIKF